MPEDRTSTKKDRKPDPGVESELHAPQHQPRQCNTESGNRDGSDGLVGVIAPYGDERKQKNRWQRGVNLVELSVVWCMLDAAVWQIDPGMTVEKRIRL